MATKYGAPLNFRAVNELEVELVHDAGDVGFVLNGFDRFFRVAVGDGTYVRVNKIAIGFDSELATGFLDALNYYSKTISNTKKG
jgi:hypothetical protein